jgi:hypothetical protein
MMLMRVKKADVKKDTFVKPDALDYCLDCWSNWMQGDDRDLSASRMKLQSGEEGGERDVYDQQRIADHRIGEAAGAAIEDLKPVHRWAIYRRCGITTQWNWPNLDFTEVLPDAEDDLRKKLLKNIATGHLF